MKAPFSQLTASPLLSNVAWVAGGTAGAQVITVASAPVLTRLYTPADFGVLAVFAAILGVIQPLATLTYSTTIPLADDDRLAGDVLRLCLLIVVALSAVLFGALICCGPYIATRFSVPTVSDYFWLIPLCFLAAGIYETLGAWATKRKWFKTIAATRVSQGVAATSIRVGLGFFGFQPLGLLLGLLASSVTGSGRMLVKLAREEHAVFRGTPGPGMLWVARRYAEFPLFRGCSRLILGINDKLPVFLMASLFGPDVVGFYGLANTVVAQPMTLIGASVARVYYAEIAEYGRSRPDKIRQLSLSIMRKMLMVGLIPTCIVIIAGPSLFRFLFGEQWEVAGDYARWLSLIIAVKFVRTPVIRSLDVFELPRVQLYLNLLGLGVIVAVFLASASLRLSSLLTVAVYSIATAASTAISLLLILAVFRQQLEAMESIESTDRTQ